MIFGTEVLSATPVTDEVRRARARRARGGLVEPVRWVLQGFEMPSLAGCVRVTTAVEARFSQQFFSRGPVRWLSSKTPIHG